MFESKEEVTLQEIGPRFTLKLRALQSGIYDTEKGEYEWKWHVCFIFINFSERNGVL